MEKVKKNPESRIQNSVVEIPKKNLYKNMCFYNPFFCILILNAGFWILDSLPFRKRKNILLPKMFFLICFIFFLGCPSPPPSLSSGAEEATTLSSELQKILDQVQFPSGLRVTLKKIEAPSPRWDSFSKEIYEQTLFILTQKNISLISLQPNAIAVRMEKELSDFYDPEKQVIKGKFLGAEAILQGRLQETQKTFQISLELLDMEKAQILSFALGHISKKWARSDHANSPHYHKGNTLREEEKWNQAIHEYDLAITQDGAQAPYFFFRGLSYSHINEKEKALDDYNQAIAMNPEDASFYNYRGLLYQNQLQEQDKAIQDYQKAINLNPYQGYAHSNLGNIYLKKKDYQRALYHQQIAGQILPENPRILYNLACTYLYHKNKAATLEYLRKALNNGLPKHIPTQDPDLASLADDPAFQEIIRGGE